MKQRLETSIKTALAIGICALLAWILIFASSPKRPSADYPIAVSSDIETRYVVEIRAFILNFLLGATGLSFLAAFGLQFVMGALAKKMNDGKLGIMPELNMEDHGPRLIPQPGFLFLPPEDVPIGFREISHHYSKQEYRIHFQTVSDDGCNLLIVESPIAMYVHSLSDLVREFDYGGIAGHVYASSTSEKITLHLIWLNPPMQRVSIGLSQRLGGSHSADDLINILQSMKPVAQTP